MERPAGTHDTKYSQDMAIVRTRLQWVLVILTLILIFTLPFFAPVQAVSFLNYVGITIIAVLGLQILTGYCGQISIGQSAFMAVGAYTSAILMTKLGFSFWVALPCAAMSAGLVGVMFGLPSVRIKGFYLAMATLAAQFIIPWAFLHGPKDITGGVTGIIVPVPTLWKIEFNTQQGMYFIIMFFAVLGTICAKNLVRTKPGRAFIAVRDNDLAASVMGISVFYTKLLAFLICSIYAGVAGALWASWMRFIEPEQFNLMASVWCLGMVIIGGMGSIAGAIFGSFLLRILEWGVVTVSPAIGAAFPALAGHVQAALTNVVFGLIIVIFVILEPRGLAYRWAILRATYRLWPFSH